MHATQPQITVLKSLIRGPINTEDDRLARGLVCVFVMQVVLAHLLRDCAGSISPKTMSAVVSVESGANPLAMHDNTQDRSFQPPDMATAISWATQLIAQGDSVDMGLSQVNSTNLPRLGLSVRSAFEPCSNLHAGATILSADYAAASAQFGPGQYALRRALSAYNSGSMFAAQGYVDRILIAAGVPPDDPTPAPVAARPRARGPVAAAIATPKPPYTESASDSGVVIINGNP